METGTTESNETQRGNAPANVSLDQLTAMLKKPRAAKGAAAAGSSPATKASATAGSKTETTTTDAAAGAVAEAGASSEGSEPVEEGRESEPELTTEGTENPETEAEETDAEGTEEEEGAEVPKSIRQLQKRVNTLTARAKAAEEQLAAQRAEFEEQKKLAREAGASGEGRGASAQGPVAGVDPRFAHDAELGKTVSKLSEMARIVAWAEDAMDEFSTGGRDEAEFGGERFTRAQVRQILRNAQAQHTELTAAKATRVAALSATFERNLAEHNAMAVKAYPWLSKPDSPEHKDAQQIMQMMPEIFNRPDRALLVADFVEGRKAREAREKAGSGEGRGASVKNGAQVVKPKPAPLPAGGSAAATRVDPKAVQEKAARDAFLKSGRTKDLTALLRMKKAA